MPLALAGFLWRNIQAGLTELRGHAKRRHLSTAILGSLLLHLTIIAVILWTPASHVRGVTEGLFQGMDAEVAGFNPVVVSLVQSKADKTLMVKGEPMPAAAAALTVRPLDPLQPTLDGGLTEAVPPLAEAVTSPEILETSPAVAAAAPQAGSQDGNTTLLEQIARCLPPDIRPVLPNTQLNLSLDIKGNLTALPVLDDDREQMSEDDIRTANFVIQAAFQCGPYVVPMGDQLTFALVPDFSAINIGVGVSAPHPRFGRGRS